MRRRHPTRVVALAAAALIAGCGDDGGTDSGTDAGTDGGPLPDTGSDTGVDAGDDAGLPDTGVDAGPPPGVGIRLAHLIANGTAVRVCIDSLMPGTMTVTGTTGPLPAAPLQFRAVSGYSELAAGADYRFRVYDAAALMVAGGCAAMITPFIEQTIPAGDVEAGGLHTVALMGIADEMDMRPVRCGSGFDEPCSAAATEPHLTVIADDPTPTAGRATIRLVNSIANFPAIEVCHDPDWMGPGSEGMGAAEVRLFAAQAYDSASDYAMVDPIAGPPGALILHLPDPGGTACAGERRGGGLPIPAPDPIGTASVPGSVKDYRAATVVTLFAIGLIDQDDPGAPDAPTFIPYLDEEP